MEITFLRSVKIWWGFMWRAWILTMPLALVTFPFMFLLIPFPKLGEPPKPIDPSSIPGLAGKLFIIWVFMMVGMVVMQSFAMRWLLKTKWSDFSLVAVPNEMKKETN